MAKNRIRKVDDCWNKIGVWGAAQPRCERLAEVIHCRNCQVFTQAGRLAFDRATPAGYVKQWTDRYCEERAEQSNTNLSIVVFRLAREWFSLPTRYFVHVEKTGFIHKIPHLSSDFLLGLVNVNGTVRLCFSIAGLLGAQFNEVAPHDDQVGVYRRFLVLSFNGQSFVFPVDEVGGIARVNTELIQNAPATLPSGRVEMIQGVIDLKGRQVAMLDSGRVFGTIEEAIRE
jgi:chemotaxis-related protein WspD